MKINSNYIDILNKKTFPASVEIENGKIKSITPIDGNFLHYIMPGFVSLLECAILQLIPEDIYLH